MCIKSVRYTDDTAVVATSNADLQRMMDKIQDKCKEYGMSLKPTAYGRVSSLKGKNLPSAVGLNTKKAMVMKIKITRKKVHHPYSLK